MATPAVASERSLIAPTEAEWRAMSPEARLDRLDEINSALSDPPVWASEGRPHKKAKSVVLDQLGLHFGSTGRDVYLAEEMAVLYPGQPSFAPDILAVLGVPQPEEDERMAWVVVDEGRGPDLILEVLHHGDRNKDLVANVARYAALGIPEYFVYDRARQQIIGYRLPGPGATRYQRILPQMGRSTSTVLGLELAVTGGKLRFYYGQAELIGTPDLIDRIRGMMQDLETKADQAQAQAEQAQSQTDQAQTEAEQAREAMRTSILALLTARGPCPDEVRAQVSACGDLATLQRWLLRAASGGTIAEILSA